MADVRLENLAAVFGTHRVFEHFTLTIRDGECFTLLGPSGCGKTVVLRMIAGFEHPGAGEVFIGDQLVSSAARKVHVPTESRNIGVVFQDYAVWPHKTVFENVVYPLQIQKVPAAEATERTLEAIEQVHLDEPGRPLPVAALRGTAAAGRPGPRPRLPAEDHAAG